MGLHLRHKGQAADPGAVHVNRLRVCSTQQPVSQLGDHGNPQTDLINFVS